MHGIGLALQTTSRTQPGSPEDSATSPASPRTRAVVATAASPLRPTPDVTRTDSGRQTEIQTASVLPQRTRARRVGKRHATDWYAADNCRAGPGAPSPGRTRNITGHCGNIRSHPGQRTAATCWEAKLPNSARNRAESRPQASVLKPRHTSGSLDPSPTEPSRQ